MSDPSSKNKTTLITAALIAAVVGGIAGAFVSTMILGSANGSELIGRSLFGESAQMSEKQVQREIIELIEEESATIAVVERVTPSVVSIVIEKRRGELISRDNEFYDPFYFPREPLSDEEATELVEIGGGTGFIVTSDGFIVTNRHVVSDEDAVLTVVTNDGAELPAELIALDPFLDIAILKIQGDTFPTASLGDSENIRIGSTVIAIGNTLSEFRNTVTKGVISGINRRVVAGDAFGDSDVIERAIQTDAAINPGNSGGPLINLLGEVVGVNTAISFEGQSVGFAIPINDVKKIISDIQEFGRIVRPWLGVRYVIIDSSIAERENLSVTQGALIVPGAFDSERAIFEGSPAQKADLQEGDIILSINGQDITQEFPLSKAISDFLPGDIIELMIARGEEGFKVEVELEELNPEQFK